LKRAPTNTNAVLCSRKTNSFQSQNTPLQQACRAFEPQINAEYADKKYLRAPRLSAARIRIVIKTQHFRNGSIASLKTSGENIDMSIDKNKIKTQDELDEPAPMDQADQRAEAEMKRLEGQAKKEVAEGLKQQDEDER